jgi:hypothetical protein
MTDQTTSTGGRRLELTIRAVVLGCILAVIFTAANTYLGLQVGLTFASAIPAAVISMAILRALRNSTIWENMTVQTVASVGGAMSAIIFVLPGLVMVGWWLEFPFWESVMICVLRRGAGRDLLDPAAPRPGRQRRPALPGRRRRRRGSEGRLARVRIRARSAVRENKAGLWVVVWGAVASAAYALGVSAKAFAGRGRESSSSCRRRWAAGPPAWASACSSPFWGPAT